MANTLFVTKAYSIVRGELFRKIPGRVTEKSDSIWICCPFHGESTPSCKVNLVESERASFGFFYCFGCQEKGPWNKLADKMGLKKFNDADVKAINGFAPNLGTKYSRIRQSMMDESDNGDWSRFDVVIERNKGKLTDLAVDWRSIPKDLLEKLGCRRLIDKTEGESFLIIPIVVNETMYGLVRAKWQPDRKGGVNYFMSKDTDVEKWGQKHGLLGYDYAKTLPAFLKYGIIFIVEGPRDAMRLLMNGIPAVAILGSQSWSASKRNHILELQPNLVCTLFDNDKAGRKAAANISESFSRRAKLHVFELPDKQRIGKKLDPMNIAHTRLMRIWKQAKRLSK